MNKKKIKSVTNLYKQDFKKEVPLLNNELGNIKENIIPNIKENTNFENVNTQISVIRPLLIGNVYDKTNDTPISVVNPLLVGNVYNKTNDKLNVTAQLLKKVNDVPVAIEKTVTLDFIPMTVYTYTTPPDIGNVNFSKSRMIDKLKLDENVNTDSSDTRPKKINEIKNYNLSQELNDKSESESESTI